MLYYLNTVTNYFVEVKDSNTDYILCIYTHLPLKLFEPITSLLTIYIVLLFCVHPFFMFLRLVNKKIMRNLVRLVSNFGLDRFFILENPKPKFSNEDVSRNKTKANGQPTNHEDAAQNSNNNL